MHRVYGQKSKLKHGNPSLMLFMPKVESSFVSFVMWGGFQIKVCPSLSSALATELVLWMFNFFFFFEEMNV
jgi:hypothetical protein